MVIPNIAANKTQDKTQAQDKEMYLFFSHLPNSTFIFPDGSQAVFAGGQYATDNKDKIEYLQYEIAQGNPHIYVRQDKITCLESDLDPEQALRKKIIAEYKEEQARIAAASSDYGSSIGVVPGKLNVVTSATVADLSSK